MKLNSEQPGTQYVTSQPWNVIHEKKKKIKKEETISRANENWSKFIVIAKWDDDGAFRRTVSQFLHFLPYFLFISLLEIFIYTFLLLPPILTYMRNICIWFEQFLLGRSFVLHFHFIHFHSFKSAFANTKNWVKVIFSSRCLFFNAEVRWVRMCRGAVWCVLCGIILLL